MPTTRHSEGGVIEAEMGLAIKTGKVPLNPIIWLMVFIAFLIFSSGVFAAEPPLKWSVEDELKYYDSLTEKYGDKYTPVPVFLDQAIGSPRNFPVFTNASYLIGKSIRFILFLKRNQKLDTTELKLFYQDNSPGGWKMNCVNTAPGRPNVAITNAAPSKQVLDQIFTTVSKATPGFKEGVYGWDAESVYITVGDSNRTVRVATYGLTSHKDIGTNEFDWRTISAIANVLARPSAKAQPDVGSGGRK